MRELLIRDETLLLRAIAAEVATVMPHYRGDLPRGHPLLEIRVAALSAAVRDFCAGGPPAVGVPAEAVMGDLGAAEARHGQALGDPLQVCWIATRVIWGHVRRAGDALGLPPESAYGCVDALIGYSTELARAIADGYRAAYEASAGAVELARLRLADAVLDPDRGDPAQLRALAVEARWALPDRASVVVAVDADPARFRMSVPSSALVVSRPDELVAIVAGLAGSTPRRALAARLDEAGSSAIGPDVALVDAAQSHAAARRAVELGRLGVFGERGCLLCEDHLDTLVISADGFLGERLSATELAPLAEAPSRSADQLRATLRAWLDHQGALKAVAAELEVHPHTVAYRLARLRELFGDRLDTADGRFALAVALRRPAPADPPQSR